MPAIVGVVQVIAIGSASVFHIGDIFRISAQLLMPKHLQEQVLSIQGMNVQLQNYQSTTNTFDQDSIDQGNFFNV